MPYFKYNAKNVFYEKNGSGYPTIFLHGNTASSKMFTDVIPLFLRNFQIILIDFAGHGKSERLDCFPTDLWHDDALQVIKLIEILNYEKVNLIGSSGGALVAINVALERPDLVNKIIADSFEGEIALDSFASTIEQDRAISKTIPEVQSFYEYNQGFDWETVIDNDTRVIKEHYKTIKCFFHHSLDTLKCDILMIGSKEDIFMPGDFYEKTYTKLIEKIGHGEKYIFSSGEHPAMISNAETFARLATKFLSE